MSKLNVDTSKWVKGKDFPEWMDEIGTIHYLTRILTTRRKCI
jgi:hypothetical protein